MKALTILLLSLIVLQVSFAYKKSTIKKSRKLSFKVLKYIIQKIQKKYHTEKSRDMIQHANKHF